MIVKTIKTVRAFFTTRRDMANMRQAVIIVARAQSGDALELHKLSNSQLANLIVAATNLDDTTPTFKVSIVGEALHGEFNGLSRKVTFSRTDHALNFEVKGPVHNLDHLKNVIETSLTSIRQTVQLHKDI